MAEGNNSMLWNQNLSDIHRSRDARSLKSDAHSLEQVSIRYSIEEQLAFLRRDVKRQPITNIGNAMLFQMFSRLGYNTNTSHNIRKVVRDFQIANGLEPDGIFGPKTFRELMRQIRKKVNNDDDDSRNIETMDTSRGNADGSKTNSESNDKGTGTGTDSEGIFDEQSFGRFLERHDGRYISTDHIRFNILQYLPANLPAGMNSIHWGVVSTVIYKGDARVETYTEDGKKKYRIIPDGEGELIPVDVTSFKQKGTFKEGKMTAGKLFVHNARQGTAYDDSLFRTVYESDHWNDDGSADGTITEWKVIYSGSWNNSYEKITGKEISIHDGIGYTERLSVEYRDGKRIGSGGICTITYKWGEIAAETAIVDQYGKSKKSSTVWYRDGRIARYIYARKSERNYFSGDVLSEVITYPDGRVVTRKGVWLLNGVHARTTEGATFIGTTETTYIVKK